MELMDCRQVVSSNSTIADKKCCQLKGHKKKKKKCRNFQMAIAGKISYANKVEKENFPTDW